MPMRPRVSFANPIDKQIFVYFRGVSSSNRNCLIIYLYILAIFVHFYRISVYFLEIQLFSAIRRMEYWRKFFYCFSKFTVQIPSNLRWHVISGYAFWFLLKHTFPVTELFVYRNNKWKQHLHYRIWGWVSNIQ